VGIIIALFIVLIGFIGLELIDGMVSLFTVNGDDEEWLAPLGMIMFIIFIISLSYLG
jgi:hypothetical protein